MRALTVLALAAISCVVAQNPAPPLVNLARLSIASVFAGHDGSTDSEKFYGVRNAFDGVLGLLDSLSSQLASSGCPAAVA